MGEILLVTSIFILAGVVYYIKKIKSFDKNKITKNSAYFSNNFHSGSGISTYQNYDYSNNGHFSNPFSTPDTRLLREDLNYKNQYINPMTQLNNLNFNNLLDSNYPTRVNNNYITPYKDHGFSKNLIDSACNISKPELINHYPIKNHDDNDENDLLPSNIENKRKRKYSDDSIDEINVKKNYEKPTISYLQGILHSWKNIFVNSKYFKLKFYNSLLISLIQIIILVINSIIRYIKGHYNENHNNSQVTDLNNIGIIRNIVKEDIRNQDSQANQKLKRNINGDLIRNMIPIYKNPEEDLNQYIKNNNKKKLNIRDIIFSDNETHGKYAHNRNIKFNQMNMIPAPNFNEERINYGNSGRINESDKNINSDYYNLSLKSKANQFSNENLIYLGYNGMECYALKPKTDIDWNYDEINSVKKTEGNRNNVYNELHEDEQMIYNNSIINPPKNESNHKNNNVNLIKIESNFNFDLINRNHNTQNLSPFNYSKDASLEEKRSSSLKKKKFHNFKIDDSGLLKQKFINSNKYNKEKHVKNLNQNLSPEISPMKEVTPKKNEYIGNKIKILKERNYDNWKTNFDQTKDENIDKSRSLLKIIPKEGKKLPSVKFIENEEAFNTTSNNCFYQYGNLKSNNFSESQISRNPLITQGNFVENKFSLNPKRDLEKILSKEKIKLNTTIFNKTENYLFDDKNILKPIMKKVDPKNIENNILKIEKITSSNTTGKSIQKINNVEQLPSSIKKTDMINSNIFQSSGNNKKIDDQMDSPCSSLLDKAMIENELENNSRLFSNDSEKKNNKYKNDFITKVKNHKEAMNYKKKSYKKMTFAPDEVKNFSNLKSYKSTKKNSISLIPEETESNITNNNLINTPSINIKKINIDYIKEKNELPTKNTKLGFLNNL